MSEENSSMTRRAFVGAASWMAATEAMTQTRTEAEAGRTSENASDPGPENRRLLEENPSSNMPPATDHGDVGPVWYSFDLVKKRLQGGGWTHQVTERELPTSMELAGVNMRLTENSYRELHWHTADEWAYVITGTTRVTMMQPDGKVFVDEIKAGGLWYFPAGFPHSLQGIGKEGTEFLLVFDDGKFSEEETFLLSDWLAHTPPEVLKKNMGWTDAEIKQLPTKELYIFPATAPRTLEEDMRALGQHLETENKYSFDLAGMAPTKQTSGGEVRVADSTNFTISKNVAAGLVRVKPGGIREMHWHPSGSEWQYYIRGSARMTVFKPGAKARTMDFNANDVGFVPTMAGHYIENTGTEDLLFLEIFKTHRFEEVSLNNWLVRTPIETVTAHLRLSEEAIRRVPAERNEVLPR